MTEIAQPPATRRSLRALVAATHYQLRTEGATPMGNAVSVGLGTFIGCLPVYGLHLLLCVTLARLVRANSIKAYLAAHINNPVTAPLLLYLELGVGHVIFQGKWPTLRLSELEDGGAWLLGRDLVVGSLVVGVALGVALGVLAWRVARRWAAAPFEERLRGETARRYLESGISHWEFVRHKLRLDPMYMAILRSGVLPREGRLVDVGCGRGILLALVDTLRRCGDSEAIPPGWPVPSDGLELVGVDRGAKTAAVAEKALGAAARIETGDAAGRSLPRADAVLLLDVLHYMTAAEQEELLGRIAKALESGGVLILREADAALGWRFLLTRAAERLCALARGHWRQKFHYRSAGEWQRLLEDQGFRVSERPMWAGTPYANRLMEARVR